ncbi:TIGR03435 family protein [Granulicella sp. dw_53]|uniref:TIGR03435 family protein n=1 Tax=Granulicella sp. dw_53 TaxID=2719792 RepID=UPI001BD56D6F|nr:TIGR03435 family protein [Granulicella sp. dw_53]
MGSLAGISCYAVNLNAQLLFSTGVSVIPSFDAATVKVTPPESQHESLHASASRTTITRCSLRHLIAFAYRAKSDSQVIGGPSWVSTKRFDIAAVTSSDEVAHLNSLSPENRINTIRLMMQSLLEERFQLRVVRSRRQLAILALVHSTDRPGLSPAPATDNSGAAIRPHVVVHNTHMAATALTMEGLAEELSEEPETEGTVIIDRTGLPGLFNFTLDWSPEATSSKDTAKDGGANAPGLFTALSEQLGLRLKREKDDVDVIEITSAQSPTPN